MLSGPFRTLIVDDEVEIQRTLTNFLQFEGYEVQSTGSPIEGLKKVQGGEIQMVVSDIAMPEMNGIDLLREIKRYNGLVQVVMITGFVTMDNVISAFRLGANNVFFKPIERLEAITAEIDLAKIKLDRIKSVLQERASLKRKLA